MVNPELALKVKDNLKEVKTREEIQCWDLNGIFTHFSGLPQDVYEHVGEIDEYENVEIYIEAITNLIDDMIDIHKEELVGGCEAVMKL